MKITKAEIRKALETSSREYPVRVAATHMGSGDHRYWKNGSEILCYGAGSNWSDQAAEKYKIDTAVDIIYQNRKNLMRP